MAGQDHVGHGSWDLEFDVSLDLGAWDLKFPVVLSSP